jgi:HemK-related putative methylase
MRNQIRRYIGKLFLSIAYPLYFKHRLGRKDAVRFLGFELTIPPSVFHPRFYLSTKVLADYFRTMEWAGLQVLEMGCGSGILSLLLASKGAQVTAVDVNPVAVACSQENISRNGYSVRVFRSDLFSDVPEGNRFDVIFWNPPFYPEEPTDYAESAWRSGRNHRVIARFAVGSKDYLQEGGRLVILLTKDIDATPIIQFFHDTGLSILKSTERKSFFERFVIYEFSRQ